MADFHVKDTYGNNYKIGGSASGIYHLPIYKLFDVEFLNILNLDSPDYIEAGSVKYIEKTLDVITNNNATFYPVGVVGYNIQGNDAYLSITNLSVYKGSGENFYLDVAIENPTNTSRPIEVVNVNILYVCAKVPWLQV